MVTVCCLNAGNYLGRGSGYVNVLFDMVRRNLPVDYPFRFVCFTDDPEGLNEAIEARPLPVSGLTGWWNKLALFKHGVFEDGERVFYLDLDTLITGPIAEILAYDGPFMLLEDFWRGEGTLQSSAMAWTAGEVDEIWREWVAQGLPKADRSDQEWIERFGPRPTFQKAFPGAFVSYKDSDGAVPQNARIVVFHGRPRPHEVVSGWVPQVWKIGGGFDKKTAFPDANLRAVFHNPDTTEPLIIPIDVLPNSSDDAILENIRVNSLRPGKWVKREEAHDRIAVICGSGPSLKEHASDVRAWSENGATIFALNGSARWLWEHTVSPDYQVLLDARPQTAQLVGPAKTRLFASQCDPECFRIAPDAVLWHCAHDRIDEVLPPYEDAYSLVGGSASVGITALNLAFVLGYRTFHLYGYDSSHEDGRGHAFEQPMNAGDPCVWVRFAAKDYLTSLTMRMQVARFPLFAEALTNLGCEINIHGSGLLPDLMKTPADSLSDEEKKQLLCQFENTSTQEN